MVNPEDYKTSDGYCQLPGQLGEFSSLTLCLEDDYASFVVRDPTLELHAEIDVDPNVAVAIAKAILEKYGEL